MAYMAVHHVQSDGIGGISSYLYLGQPDVIVVHRRRRRRSILSLSSITDLWKRKEKKEREEEEKDNEENNDWWRRTALLYAIVHRAVAHGMPALELLGGRRRAGVDWLDRVTGGNGMWSVEWLIFILIVLIPPLSPSSSSWTLGGFGWRWRRYIGGGGDGRVSQVISRSDLSNPFAPGCYTYTLFAWSYMVVLVIQSPFCRPVPLVGMASRVGRTDECRKSTMNEWTSVVEFLQLAGTCSWLLSTQTRWFWLPRLDLCADILASIGAARSMVFVVVVGGILVLIVLCL